MNTNPGIAILDYGVGNLHSVLNACRQYTESVVVTDDKAMIESAHALILPGVGAFETGMQGLRVRGLEQTVKDFAASGKPVLGICLGAQLLLSKGYEFGEWDGLGLIPGSVRKFPEDMTPRLPHIGWNTIYGFDADQPLLSGLTERSEVYFVHSYILMPENASHAVAHSNYGEVEFTSVIRKGNIWGCQFHPEKSGKNGMFIIENFVRIANT
jgi:glutamine amidotransferase